MQAQASSLSHATCLVSQVNGVSAPFSATVQNLILFNGLRDKGYNLDFSDESGGLNLTIDSRETPMIPRLGSMAHSYETYRSRHNEDKIRILRRQVQLIDNSTGQVLIEKSRSTPLLSVDVSDRKSTRLNSSH